MMLKGLSPGLDALWTKVKVNKCLQNIHYLRDDETTNPMHTLRAEKKMGEA